MKHGIFDYVKRSWQLTKDNLWFLIAFLLVVYAANFLGAAADIGFLVNIFTGFVVIGVFLRLSRGERLAARNIFDGFSGDKLFQYLLVTLVTSIFILVGLVLLVVPGIIVAIMTIFAAYIIVDGDRTVSWKSRAFWEAIKKSKAMTSGVKWRLFGFLLFAFFLNLVGMLLFGVGLLITVPVTGIALSLMYDELKHKTPAAVRKEALPPPSEHTH